VNYDAIAFWSQIAGFLLFSVVLCLAFAKWIVPAAGAAQKASNDRIALAVKRRDEVQGALGALQHAIEGAKLDAAAMVERAKDRGEHEKSAIIAEAKDAGERAVRNAEGELDRARAEARAQLREQLANKALEIARSTASSRIDASVDQRLVEEFLGQVNRG
jgi:F-type H+-transporting ATPase subunit b